uniref:Uncharacterized protein n=1 Tax=Arundo donax TaxID=35708 RepID=A0A0A9G6P3_ARUDO
MYTWRSFEDRLWSSKPSFKKNAALCLLLFIILYFSTFPTLQMTENSDYYPWRQVNSADRRGRAASGAVRRCRGGGAANQEWQRTPEDSLIELG